MAANPTLINGFEDVLTFISQQADRIKKLEEENQKHKTTILSLKTSVDDLREARDMRDSKIKNLMDENKKLKIEMGEELEQLKEELEEAHHQYDLLKEKITCLESDSYNEVSQAEYDELKEENQKLKEEAEQNKQLFDTTFRELMTKGEVDAGSVLATLELINLLHHH